MKSCIVWITVGVLCMAGLAIAQEGGGMGAGEKRGSSGWAKGARGERSGGGEFMQNREGRGGEGRGGDRGEGGPVERILSDPRLAKEIGLTDEQVQSFRKTWDDLRKKEIDLRAEHEKMGLDQARLITDEGSKEDDIMAVIEKTGQIQTEMAKIRVQKLLAVRKALTPEQRENLHKMMKRRMEAWRDREGEEGSGARMEEMKKHRSGTGGGSGREANQDTAE